MRLLPLCVVAALAGCGDVTITQVNANGGKLAGAQEGFYVPRLMPYLIVADLPADQTTPKGAMPAPKRVMPATPKQNANTGAANTGATEADKTTTPASTSSDLSFQGLTKQYTIKLVYLPDYSHQQAIKATSGLFGKASLQMQLIDGSLSSFTANSDNTENGEVFKAALTAAITAASGGAAGAPAAAGAGMSAAEKLALQQQTGNPRSGSDSILHPGIYQLVYNQAGYFVGLKRISGFCSATGTASTTTASQTLRNSFPPSSEANNPATQGLIEDACTGTTGG